MEGLAGCRSQESHKESIRTLSSTIASRFSDEDELHMEVEKLLSFERCPELLRGSSLYNILRCGGQIFQDSSGSAQTYRLSQRVSRLDMFFSHNWACPRIHKLLCLMLHFNLWPAFLGTLVWMMVILLLTALGWAPLVQLSTGYGGTSGILGYLTTMPVFGLLLFGYHEILPCGRFPRVFLDKTCIHQEDEEMKKMGIEKLGAFLSSADSVLVCYTPLYLKKLWTIYEAATFLCLKRVEHLHVVPFQLPWVFVVSATVLWFFNCCGIALRAMGGEGADNFELLISPVLLFSYTVTCRRMARAKADIRTTLENFKVDDCNCFDERDRSVVYRNIALLMHARFNLPRETTEKEALAKFEELVKKILPVAFNRSLGHGNIPYKFVAIVCVITWIPRAIDNFACHVEDGKPVKYYLLSWGLVSVFVATSAAPLCFMAMDHFACCRLHWTGCWGVLWTCFCCVGAYMIFLFCYLPPYWFMWPIEDSSGDPWTEELEESFVRMLTYTIITCSILPLLISGHWKSVLGWFKKSPLESQEEYAEMSSAIDSVRVSVSADMDEKEAGQKEGIIMPLTDVFSSMPIEAPKMPITDLVPMADSSNLMTLQVPSNDLFYAYPEVRCRL